ncbi:SDR family NAD(P)-dependent oxidoreductase [Actinacidiphila sp. bgisy145]|uniref:SDR family NAD(P)-dependent oxidoreductase n=1 Tax=Actinacidiphila sp. bgisy145 TaxID=3413792 RepID=UPI003EC0C037
MSDEHFEPPAGPALVTGATSGLGTAVAWALAERGWTVLVHGRDARRTDAVVAELRAAGHRAHPYLADLASLRECAELAQRVAADHPSLELVVNNAGVGFGADQRRRELSADGYELRLAVNYLAPVVLTRMLRAPLRAAGRAQVLNIGSVGQSPLPLDDPQFTHGYSGSEAYTRSKFALAAFTFATAEQYGRDGIQVNVCHPATYMDTAMTHDSGITPWTSVDEGVGAVLTAVRAGQRGRTGLFFNGTSTARAHSRAYDKGFQQRLADLTSNLLSRVEGVEAAVW